MVIKKKKRITNIKIDLTGPEGNAYYLLGTASNYLKQLGKDEKYIEKIINEMKSSDYENLVSIFDREFGHFITLYR